MSKTLHALIETQLSRCLKIHSLNWPKLTFLMFYLTGSVVGAPAGNIPYTLTFNATVTGSKVKDVTSDSDKITVTYNDSRDEAKVRFGRNIPPEVMT